MSRKTFFTGLFLCLTATCQAQFLQVNFDKKVIYPDSLNLSGNHTAQALLYLLPELLDQSSSASLSDYDVLINDMSVGNSKDGVLQDLRLYEIEKVEICESPISSYQNNGQGGTINIILRDKSKMSDKKFYGGFSLDGSYPKDFTPQLNIGYTTDKFSIHGLAMGEWYNYTKNLDITIDGVKGVQDKDIHNRDAAQMARIYTKFMPTQKDLIKFNLSESSSNYHTLTTLNEDLDIFLNQRNRCTTLQTLVNYKHTFSPHSALETEIQYQYQPDKEVYYDPKLCDYIGLSKTNNVSGKIEFKTALVPEVIFPKGYNKHYADITFGVNMNGIFQRRNTESSDLRYSYGTKNYEHPRTNTLFVMPYAQIEAGLGKFRFKGVAEYQHYEYNIHKDNTPSYSVPSNDFTGKIMLEWHFTSSHNLRFILDRKLQRPDDDEIYPYRRYNSKYMCYVEGCNLRPINVTEFTIDYISHFNLGHKQTLTLNVSANYNDVNDIIQLYQTGGNSYSGAFGMTQQYYTFNQTADCNLFNFNLMTAYTYKGLSIAFTGTATHERFWNGSVMDQFTYFNLSLFPTIQMRHGWTASINARYYSRVRRLASRLGDYGQIRAQVGKSFGPVTLSLYGSIAPGGQVFDITYGDQTTTTAYFSERNCAGLGVHWRF